MAFWCSATASERERAFFFSCWAATRLLRASSSVSSACVHHATLAKLEGERRARAHLEDNEQLLELLDDGLKGRLGSDGGTLVGVEGFRLLLVGGDTLL